MRYYCPKCDEWCEYDSHNYSDYWFQSDNQAGVEDQTIIDEWETIPTPPPPELKPVVITPKTSALLILDMETSICNNPRCLASISKINDLLTIVRREGMLVVYSLTHTGYPADIIRQIAPTPDDPIVRSNVDKFYKTNLNKILQENGVKTVIITGYAANGAVLHTATSASFRGYNVIIPVDGMSARDPFAEQYTAWHMLNSPGTRNRATLTKVSLIDF
ncbi:cysteine hydrolase [Pelosinus sp. IPA-1]|uniref:cysteine hydrolase n=1 Tax=Pelosinus sp. IPA-1 TaxID=3029569 RepID=UPI0024361635|nr:cysteine hydrolase [Pelosinus sp. IPA-1]GMB00477.1 isochorismatase [Pelosinus sp. IPA-1]